MPTPEARASLPPGRASASAYVVLVTIQLLFGLHYFAAQRVVREIPPEAWAPIRAVAATLFLTALARALGRRLPRDPRTLLSLATLAVFGVVINQLMFVKGIALTHTAHSALIMSSIPVMTLAIAVVLGRERLSLLKALGVLVGLSGMLILLRVDTLSLSLDDKVVRGDVYTLINAISFSLFLVISRPVLLKLDSIGATAVVFQFGSAMLLVLGAPSLLKVEPASLSPTAWFLAVFIVLGPTVGGYVAQFFVLRRFESSLVALFIYLQFVIAALIGVVFLGEGFDLRLRLAAGLVLLGLLFGSRAQRR
jgi:drug/metabolite transporter (DMT)-like permease